MKTPFNIPRLNMLILTLFFWEKFKNGQVIINNVLAADQPVDNLTKQIDEKWFIPCRKKLGVMSFLELFCTGHYSNSVLRSYFSTIGDSTSPDDETTLWCWKCLEGICCLFSLLQILYFSTFHFPLLMFSVLDLVFYFISLYCLSALFKVSWATSISQTLIQFLFILSHAACMITLCLLLFSTTWPIKLIFVDLYPSSISLFSISSSC